MTRVGSTRRRVVGLVTAWLVVVLVVGGVTFAVVSRASSAVGQASALRTLAPAVASTSGGTAAPGSRSPSRSATGTPSPSSEDDAPEPADTPEPSHQGGTPTPRTTATTPRPRTTAPKPPATRTTSFTTQGGTVVASCTGSRIDLESITARDGWRFEDERESRKLEIHFSRNDSAPGESGVRSEDEGEVELTLECVGGVPTRTGER